MRAPQRVDTTAMIYDQIEAQSHNKFKGPQQCKTKRGGLVFAKVSSQGMDRELTFDSKETRNWQG
jgi:hypothetical protein